MVSMFVDIRQAAELLAFHTGHDSLKMANEISQAGQFHGLKFRLRTNQTIDWSPGFFTVCELPNGKRYVKPVGGQRSPMVKVSIADIVKNPFFRFDEEIQHQILEAHKSTAQVTQEPEAESVEKTKKRYKRIGWAESAAFEYVTRIFKDASPRPSAKVLYDILLVDADSNSQSPFEKKLQELILKKSGKVLAEKTLANAMKKIRKESQKIIP